MTATGGRGRSVALVLVMRWFGAAMPVAALTAAVVGPARPNPDEVSIEPAALASNDSGATASVLVAATNRTPPFAGALSLRITGGAVTLTQVDPGTPAGRPATDPAGHRHALVFTGSLTGVSVQDTRPGEPGWTVTGQASDFRAGSGSVPAQNLGWTPTLVTSGSDAEGTVAAGGAVDPALKTPTSHGLAGPGSVLASSRSGSGLGVQYVAAGFQLWIPDSTLPTVLTSTLTLTLVSS